MNIYQNTFILLFGIFAAISFLKGFSQSLKYKNPFGTPWKALSLISIYAWADAVVFGAFWALVSLICLILNDWILFLLTYSLFWLVRSTGETIYWFLQQFSTINRNPPQKYTLLIKVFHNDSVWFVHQGLNQCISVVSIITSVYLFHLWLK